MGASLRQAAPTFNQNPRQHEHKYSLQWLEVALQDLSASLHTNPTAYKPASQTPPQTASFDGVEAVAGMGKHDDNEQSAPPWHLEVAL
jgi:hypothetical protein